MIVAATAVSHVDGIGGRLLYRGYDAIDLARCRSIEDVWHLLVHGELPANGDWARAAAELRGLPIAADVVPLLATRDGSFMLALEAAIAATGAAWRVEPWYGESVEGAAHLGLSLASVMPTLVAALWRARTGRPFVAPDPTLGHAANYLWMLNGEQPSGDQATALERYLVLAADHGMNASTFTARVIASTGADVVSAVVGAAGALSGPLHGGAPSLVLDMLDRIGTEDRVEPWIRATLATGDRLMGFGHRVYRAEDPRARCLREVADTLGGRRVALARAVERVALAELRRHKAGRALFTNVEFYAAVVLEGVGIPRELFTPTFGIARTLGWSAHVLEQIAGNRLIRPAADYVGPRARRLENPAALEA